MMECSKENLHLCGDPPLTFTRESLCEDGGGSIILGFALICIVFMFFQAIYHWGGVEKKGICDRDTRFGLWRRIERIFILPFIPTNIESLVSMYGILWFAMTIPMAFTRYYTHRWQLEMLAQQGIFDLLFSRLFGCKTVGFESVVYTEMFDNHNHTEMKRTGLASLFWGKHEVDDDMLKKEGYFEMIDYLFTLHLTFGLLWLTLGGVQIYKAQHGWSTDDAARRRAHRTFGYVAGLALIAHTLMATTMAWKNPVNQNPFIQFMYAMFLHGTYTRTCKGLYYAREAGKLRRIESKLKKAGGIASTGQPGNVTEDMKHINIFMDTVKVHLGVAKAEGVDQDKAKARLWKSIIAEEDEKFYALVEKDRDVLLNRHKVAMVRNYVWSTFGSGGIRLTSWILWCIAKFFPFELRILIDRGECQNYAETFGSDFKGMADYCMPSVFHNLLLTLLLQDWIDWLFLCMLESKGDANPDDKNEIKLGLRSIGTTLLFYIPALVFCHHYEQDYQDTLVKWALVGTVISYLPMMRETFADVKGALLETVFSYLRKMRKIFGDGKAKMD